MAYQIERPSPCRVVVSATVPPATRCRRSVSTSWPAVMRRRARSPGFRPGQGAARRWWSAATPTTSARRSKSTCCVSTWQAVREGEKLRPATPLGVKEVSWKDDGSLELSGEFEVFPQVELPTVDGFVPPPFDLEPDRRRGGQGPGGSARAPGDLGAAGGHAPSRRDAGRGRGLGLLPGRRARAVPRGAFAVRDGRAARSFPRSRRPYAATSRGEEVTTAAQVSHGERRGQHQDTVDYRVAISSVRRKRRPELDDDVRDVAGGRRAASRRCGPSVEVDLGGEKQRAPPRRLARVPARPPLRRSRCSTCPRRRSRRTPARRSWTSPTRWPQRGIDPEKASLDWEKLGAELRARVETRMRAELLLDALADALDVTVGDARSIARSSDRRHAWVYLLPRFGVICQVGRVSGAWPR